MVPPAYGLPPHPAPGTDSRSKGSRSDAGDDHLEKLFDDSDDEESNLAAHGFRLVSLPSAVELVMFFPVFGCALAKANQKVMVTVRAWSHSAVSGQVHIS